MTQTPSALHHTLIAEGDIVHDPGAAGRWLLQLHGIYGSGSNWHTFAKRLTERRPDWGVVTVDLRKHGRSQDLPGPHHLDACVQDLLTLERELGLPITATSGHSLGGKVAILHAAARASAALEPLEALWVLDSNPGSGRDRPYRRGDDARLVGSVLESLPADFPSRQSFLEALEAQGLARRIARWLGMNLRRDGDRFRLQMDLPALHALLDDHLRRDLWPVVEGLHAGTEVHFVVGDRSRVLPPDFAETLAERGRKARGQWTVSRLRDAGHWLHVDDADGTLRAVLRYL